MTFPWTKGNVFVASFFKEAAMDGKKSPSGTSSALHAPPKDSATRGEARQDAKSIRERCCSKSMVQWLAGNGGQGSVTQPNNNRAPVNFT